MEVYFPTQRNLPLTERTCAQRTTDCRFAELIKTGRPLGRQPADSRAKRLATAVANRTKSSDLYRITPRREFNSFSSHPA